MAESKASVVDTLEQAIDQLVNAWNRVHEFPGGGRLLHRLFGHSVPSGTNTGGHSFASLVTGTARVIGEEERRLIPQEIIRVREELAKAARVAAGEE